MKRIQNSDVWTDGVINYRKNEAGEFVIYVEPENIVELEEEVVLKPEVDNEE